ncbi:class I SAM-dependent methyltransferase [Nocardia mexicana]|uniref:Methyltransferase family protein n=1 Tax=Nocardia mexicana TaxID=279262 RepID=A0A370HDE9_9NOCA|nr:class I SAM-dependent methyltransferase [Nocardia mexicana]RDI55261.1 methyltransferase family protein [Nocardia mexicana]
MTKSKDEFRHVYGDPTVLGTKLDVHARYSRKPTDIPRAIATRCGAPSDLEILDIGCGTGHLIEYLSGHGHWGRLVGLDLVRPPIADTAAKQYVVGDAEAVPFPDNSFDVITCVHTLSHIDDLAAAMREARRVLRPGGMFIASANSLTSYPHVDRYRRRVHRIFGWGEPTFTTTTVNAENLGQVLASFWHVATVETLAGELRIPVQKFTPYFAANIPTWDVIPTDAQYGDILQWVAGWSVDDQESGYLTEPKKIALAICSEP